MSKFNDPILVHIATVREHFDSVAYIKTQLAIGNLSAALEAWRELGEDVMRILWRAPSKGGIFTTQERKLLDQASVEDYLARP